MRQEITKIGQVCLKNNIKFRNGNVLYSIHNICITEVGIQQILLNIKFEEPKREFMKWNILIKKLAIRSTLTWRKRKTGNRSQETWREKGSLNIPLIGYPKEEEKENEVRQKLKIP